MTQSSKKWVFTWNNYTKEQKENLANLKKDEIEFIVFGEEIGESGTPHLQGYIETLKKVRLAGAKSIVDKINKNKSPIHMSIAIAKNRMLAINYCKKGKQSHKEWEEFKELGPTFGLDAKITELNFIENIEKKNEPVSIGHAILASIANGSTLGDLTREFPDETLKYPNGIKALQDRIEGIKREDYVKEHNKELDDKFKQIEWFDWQKILINKMKTKPHDREIIWFADLEGGSGKTTIAKYIRREFGAAILNNGKTADLARIYNYEPIVIFNLPRTCEERVNYGFLENLKDGLIMSTKYDPIGKEFKTPHVVVMANFMPQKEALTRDRWNIIPISNKKETNDDITEYLFNY